jgi:hypothetical protein
VGPQEGLAGTRQGERRSVRATIGRTS